MSSAIKSPYRDQVVEPWCACPECKVERFHLILGEVEVPTEYFVNALGSLTRIPIEVVRWNEPKPIHSVVSEYTERMHVMRISMRRECRECGRTWLEYLRLGVGE